LSDCSCQGDSLFTMRKDEPLARTAFDAIRRGDVEALTRLLDANPGLANVRIGGEPNAGHPDEMSRTLLHVATDWPGHFPSAPAERIAR
jgi:hypothetical protein